jgi:hypothetical protein
MHTRDAKQDSDNIDFMVGAELCLGPVSLGMQNAGERRHTSTKKSTLYKAAVGTTAQNC